MSNEIIKLIATVLVLIVLSLFALISLLGVFIFIKYGRTRSITVLISLIFLAAFVIGGLSLFNTLNNF